MIRDVAPTLLMAVIFVIAAIWIYGNSSNTYGVVVGAVLVTAYQLYRSSKVRSRR